MLSQDYHLEGYRSNNVTGFPAPPLSQLSKPFPEGNNFKPCLRVSVNSSVARVLSNPSHLSGVLHLSLVPMIKRRWILDYFFLLKKQQALLPLEIS